MKSAAFAAAFLVLSMGAAQAHNVIPGVAGFSGGIAHPLLVLSHALSLLALGLLAGMQPPLQRAALIAVCLAAMAVSFAMITFAYSSERAELLVLVLAVLTGLALASGLKVSFAIAAALAACLGSAILVDSVPAVPSVRETLLTLSGTALAAIVMIAVVAFLSATLPAFWQRIGIRVAGSWIAASAILVLALRLAKL